MTDTIQRPTYRQMVKDLFKHMDGPGAMMLHAAVGIAGESGELRQATSRKNLIEECGDIEFYIEAAWQQMGGNERNERARDFLFVSDATVGSVIDRIHTIGADILDHAKKVWVYQGSKGNRDNAISLELVQLEVTLDVFYKLIGTDRSSVQVMNQNKLLGNAEIAGRYASGKYSDEQALARADKLIPGAKGQVDPNTVTALDEVRRLMQPKYEPDSDQHDTDPPVGNGRSFLGQQKP